MSTHDQGQRIREFFNQKAIALQSQYEVIENPMSRNPVLSPKIKSTTIYRSTWTFPIVLPNPML